jgi:hypothetical protein
MIVINAASFVGIEHVADAGEDLLVEIDRVHHRQFLGEIAGIERDQIGYLPAFHVDDTQDLALADFGAKMPGRRDRLFAQHLHGPLIGHVITTSPGAVTPSAGGAAADGASMLASRALDRPECQQASFRNAAIAQLK